MYQSVFPASASGFHLLYEIPDQGKYPAQTEKGSERRQTLTMIAIECKADQPDKDKTSRGDKQCYENGREANNQPDEHHPLDIADARSIRTVDQHRDKHDECSDCPSRKASQKTWPQATDSKSKYDGRVGETVRDPTGADVNVGRKQQQSYVDNGEEEKRQAREHVLATRLLQADRSQE